MKNYEKQHLEALVVQAKMGDIQAKEEILMILTKSIRYYASRFFIKGYDLEDLMSEGYNTVLKALNMYKIEGNCFYTYSCRSIENTYRHLLRSNKVPEDKNCITLTDALSDVLDSGEVAVEDKAYINILKLAIDKLPLEEKEVIRKIYLQDHSIGQVARDKGLTYSRVQYLRNKGLTNLKGIV